jgi:rhodanese-related sulfurtransferase
VVSTATFKIDGLFFFLGALFGVFLFGETEIYFDEFWHSGFYGRLTLMDVFNLPTGVVVLLVVLMALFMFWGGEQLERIFGKRDLKKEPRLRYAGALTLVAGALLVIAIGQPDTGTKWAKVGPEKESLLENREVYIHPGEVLATMADDTLRPILLDLRPEADYNLFHLEDARNVQIEDLSFIIPELLTEPAANNVIILMGNDETLATEAWKILTAESVINVYILEGGINNWIRTFAAEDPQITPTPSPTGNETLKFTFNAALGSRYDASFPNPHEWELEYTPKIKLELKRSPSGGGCG